MSAASAYLKFAKMQSQDHSVDPSGPESACEQNQRGDSVHINLRGEVAKPL